MDKYERVQKKIDQDYPENLIRISKRRAGNYISYALRLFNEKNFDTVILRASGRTMNKATIITEILKRRIHDLH